jgi:Gas vesicle synthesis protein GvpL/GvpF
VSAEGRAARGAGWYVYGVVPAEEAHDGLFAAVRGVAGGPVEVLGAGPLAAIATHVPLDEFGEEAIASNLRDPEWLEGRVRAHEDVLEAALGSLPVVPFRFGTIYRSEEHVRKMLSQNERLVDAVGRVRGRVELGVKGFLATTSAADPAGGEAAGASAGRRYLEGKQRARRLGEEREALKARAADESHERLAAAAEAATANPLQSQQVSGREEEMFLNAAYLVATKREREFRAVVAELERELGPTGVVYDVTGPWPPYNFVEDFV